MVGAGSHGARGRCVWKFLWMHDCTVRTIFIACLKARWRRFDKMRCADRAWDNLHVYSLTEAGWGISRCIAAFSTRRKSPQPSPQIIVLLTTSKNHHPSLSLKSYWLRSRIICVCRQIDNIDLAIFLTQFHTLLDVKCGESPHMTKEIWATHLLTQSV